MMTEYQKTIGTTTVPYILSGESPTFLFLAGTHGDETGVIQSVRRTLHKFSGTLPPFLFIPEVSPSAVKAKTRFNRDGVDLNRNFFNDSSLEEIQIFREIVKDHHFETCISFHEDPEFSDFYLYDAFGQNIEGTSKRQDFFDELRSHKVTLLNGTDDPTDPTLGSVFIDGYNWSPPIKENTHGFQSEYLFVNGFIRRYLNPEIPGKIDQKLKDLIIDIIFRHFVVL